MNDEEGVLKSKSVVFFFLKVDGYFAMLKFVIFFLDC